MSVRPQPAFSQIIKENWNGVAHSVCFIRFGNGLGAQAHLIAFCLQNGSLEFRAQLSCPVQHSGVMVMVVFKYISMARSACPEGIKKEYIMSWQNMSANHNQGQTQSTHDKGRSQQQPSPAQPK